MSESIRTEQERLIAELETLVNGLSAEVTRLHDRLQACEDHLTKMILQQQKEA